MSTLEFIVDKFLLGNGSPESVDEYITLISNLEEFNPNQLKEIREDAEKTAYKRRMRLNELNFLDTCFKRLEGESINVNEFIEEIRNSEIMKGKDLELMRIQLKRVHK